MGRSLDILRRAEAAHCDKSDESDKRPTFGRLRRFGRTLQALAQRCPAYVALADWRQAVADGHRFPATWGEQAEAPGWTEPELFGLRTLPEQPAASYRRLSIYALTGLWLLQGRPVVALTAEMVAAQTKSGGILTYRKHNKPALDPVGESLDNFDGALR